MFDFKEQLAIGDKGEQLFERYYPEPITKSEDRKYDFLTESGVKIELKTDSYDMDKTDNFFLERYSDVNRKTPGGPWRAEIDKVDLFIYMFSSNKTYYKFDNLPQLIPFLNNLTSKSGLVYIKNRGWTTAGYKVPRSKLVEFYTEIRV